MNYSIHTTLKDGRECFIRALSEEDAQITLDNFKLTHGESENLLAYPDESGDVEFEQSILKSFFESERNVLMGAFVDGQLTGTASIAAVSFKDKAKHRAELGIAVAKKYWNLGIGRALMEGCIHCAYKAGYSQVELDAVDENRSALKLYESLGFKEYGRNPKGFRTRAGVWQELVYMRLELFAPYIETKRTFMRRIGPEDCKKSFAWSGDERVYRYLLHGKIDAPEELLPWLSSLDRESEEGYVMLASSLEDGHAIGTVALFRRSEDDTWTLAYNIRYDDWNKGYATETEAALIEYARIHNGAHRFEGECAKENKGSAGVMKKLGMHYSHDSSYSKHDGSAVFESEVYILED